MPDAPFVPDTDSILREQLHALPVPDVSPDFNARVWASLHAPRSLWQTAWDAVRGDVRPLLTGAACALPVTLLCLLWTLHSPATSPPAPPFAAAQTAVSGTRGPSLDALLDKPNLSAADLWKQERTPLENPPALPTPAPRRRACLPCPPTLAA